MRSRSKLLLFGLTTIAVAGCGSASASGVGGASSTPAAAGRGGGGTAGQLVQINGSTLILSTAAGDVSVDFTGSTTIVSTSTGSTADIVPGSCVVIAGQKDATGAVTATTVRLSQPVNGACTLGAQPGGTGGSPRPFPTGGARPSGAPTFNPNAAFVAGTVTSVTGTTVTVTSPAGTTTSVTVPTTLPVTEATAGTAADLTVDSCVRAIGPKNTQGVVEATALTIQPTNASGTCTFGGGGFGGFGGRGGRGGAPPIGG